MAEPGSLAEGWCPPDSGWGHLFLAEGVFFKLLSWFLTEGDNVPSPQIVLAGEKQTSLSVRDQQNQLLGIIHMPRELAGSWKKCCFSLPFPQIAVLGKHPALKLCQPQGRCFSTRQGAREGECRGSVGPEPVGLGKEPVLLALCAEQPSVALGTCRSFPTQPETGWAEVQWPPPTVQSFPSAHGARWLKWLGSRLSPRDDPLLKLQLEKVTFVNEVSV